MNTIFRGKFRIGFQLAQNTSFNFLSEELRELYKGELEELLKSYIETLSIPLPSAEYLTIKRNMTKLTKSFIIFAINYSILDKNNRWA